MRDYQAHENLSYHGGPVRAGPDSEMVFLSVIHARARVISEVHVRACMCVRVKH